MTFTKSAKWISTLSLSLLLAACGNGDEEATETDTGSEDTGTEEASGDFDTSQDIHVITREEGSGTRGAFDDIVY